MTQDKQKLWNYLQTQHLMALATKGKDMWIASVYYAVDKDFNFYFVSGPKSQHCQDIEKNPEVACAIADSSQPNGSKEKIGVQMRGKIKMVTNLVELTKAITLWNKANPGAEKWISLKNIREKAVSSRIYKIVPQRIKFFNQVNGEDNEQVFDF